MSRKRKVKKRKNTFVPIIILSIILLGIVAGNIALKSTLQTRSSAEDAPTPTGPDCASDPQREDYCGDSAPFRGCNGGGEWLCQCRLPSGKWWSECSVIESGEEKQRYRDKCGGDDGKANLQWKYDVALAETGGQCSCGGQNLCGSLVPTRGANPKFPPAGSPPVVPTYVIDTPIATPTLTYRVIDQPTIPKRIYIPPTNIPISVRPTINYSQPTNVPANNDEVILSPTPVSRQGVNIDFSGINKFFEETKKSIVNFFSQVLP
ncbi:hypothetical protein HY029_01310 [Candidatus Gottesmanbacteria bacterium]|nr:hypothetical protein [Candidatus Gottesmanbacteria bacterium]